MAGNNGLVSSGLDQAYFYIFFPTASLGVTGMKGKFRLT
jgi:hypothetical protein